MLEGQGTTRRHGQRVVRLGDRERIFRLGPGAKFPVDEDLIQRQIDAKAECDRKGRKPKGDRRAVEPDRAADRAA